MKQCQRSSSSSATNRRVSDDAVSLVRSEYSDEIRHRNQREDRKLENARRYLDRACRVVSNELDQHRATIMRSLARTRHVASAVSDPAAAAATTAATTARRRCDSAAEAKRPASASTSANDSRRKRGLQFEGSAVGYEPLHSGTGTSPGVVQTSNGTRKTASRERAAELNQANSSAATDDRGRVERSASPGQGVVKKETNPNRPILSINRPIRIGSKGFGCQKYRYLLNNNDSSHTASNVNEIQVLNPRPETAAELPKRNC